MKLTVHLEGKTKADLVKGLQAHLALFGETTTTTKTRSRKTAEPEETVDDEEDEDFGKKTLKKKDVEEDDEEELEASDDEDEEEETDEDESEDDDDAPTVDFKTLRAAVNKYGEKKPEDMRAILAGFKIKSPKELSATKNEKHWDGVYRKVMAKLKTTKGKK